MRNGTHFIASGSMLEWGEQRSTPPTWPPLFPCSAGDLYYDDDDDGFVDVDMAPESAAHDPDAAHGELLLCSAYLASEEEAQSQALGARAALSASAVRGSLHASASAFDPLQGSVRASGAGAGAGALLRDSVRGSSGVEGRQRQQPRGGGVGGGLAPLHLPISRPTTPSLLASSAVLRDSAAGGLRGSQADGVRSSSGRPLQASSGGGEEGGLRQSIQPHAAATVRSRMGPAGPPVQNSLEGFNNRKELLRSPSGNYK